MVSEYEYNNGSLCLPAFNDPKYYTLLSSGCGWLGVVCQWQVLFQRCVNMVLTRSFRSASLWTFTSTYFRTVHVLMAVSAIIQNIYDSTPALNRMCAKMSMA